MVLWFTPATEVKKSPTRTLTIVRSLFKALGLGSEKWMRFN